MRPKDEHVSSVGDPGWSYELVRRLFGRSLKVFFRQIEVEGAENVPASGGGILIAWHPNAIIDGMLLAVACPRPVTFGARHGLFAVPLFGWILRMTGTVPIYRTIDRKDPDETARRAANVRSLDALARAVASGRLCSLFPEGRSHDAPQPTRMKTGAARLLDRAKELGGDGAAPLVIPVGLDYGAKDRGRSTVLLRFHPPLVVPEQLLQPPDGESDEAFYARMRAITDVFESAVYEVVLATEDWGMHRLMHRTRKLMRAEIAQRRATAPGPATLSEKRAGLARVWTAYRKVIERNPDGAAAVVKQLEDYDHTLREIGLEDHDLDRDRAPSGSAFWLGVVRAAFLSALLAPIVLIGYVTNGPTGLLIGVLARVAGREAKDRATIKVLAGMLLLPLTWMVLGVLSAYAVSRWVAPPLSPAATAGIGVAVALLGIVGLWGWLAFNRIAYKTVRRIRVRARRRRHRTLVGRLLDERSRLLDVLLKISEGVPLPGRIASDGRVRPE